MANVLLYGFSEPEKVEKQIAVVLKEIGADDDSSTTVVESKSTFCATGKNAPYLVVEHSKSERAAMIAAVLWDRLGFDTQWQALGGYLAARKPPAT